MTALWSAAKANALDLFLAIIPRRIEGTKKQTNHSGRYYSKKYSQELDDHKIATKVTHEHRVVSFPSHY